MSLGDLVFLFSIAGLAVGLGRLTYCLLARRPSGAKNAAQYLFIFIGLYAFALVTVALATPRRFYAPAERRCFDDWCIAALTATPIAARPECVGTTLAGNQSQLWQVELEVSSVAKGIRQRAADVHAELEDPSGYHYLPCLALSGSQARTLNDQLGPGDSFRVPLAFELPAGTNPQGVVVYHGAFPGVIIIGDDQSFLHQPALLKLSVVQSH